MAERLQRDPRLPIMQQLRTWIDQRKVSLDQAVQMWYEEYSRWETAQDQADTEKLYAGLRSRFGEWTVGIGINDQGNFSAEAFKRLEAAYYTGFAQSCIGLCIYEDNVGCGAAHYNTITPAAVKRRFRQLLTMNYEQGRDLSLNEALLITQGDRTGLLLSQTTPEDRTQTADFTLRAAMNQFLSLPGAKKHRNTAQIRGIGIFYLPTQEIGSIEHQSKSTLSKNGFNPTNLLMKLCQEGGFMYGPYNHHFSTPGFYP